jgi:Carboxypeptidase regulatory-like domain
MYYGPFITSALFLEAPMSHPRQQWRKLLLTAFPSLMTILFFLPAAGAAQEITGTILGTVTDTSGAIVANAQVTITNTDRRAVVRSVKTNSAGAYNAPLLPVGHYSVSIEASGFQKVVETNIMLNVSDKRAVNASLQVGNVASTVTVQANALQVNTESDAATGLITGTQVRARPAKPQLRGTGATPARRQRRYRRCSLRRRQRAQWQYE